MQNIATVESVDQKMAESLLCRIAVGVLEEGSDPSARNIIQADSTINLAGTPLASARRTVPLLRQLSGAGDVRSSWEP